MSSMTVMERFFQEELKLERDKLPVDIQNKRNEIIRELIESEDIYIANLKTLITHYREDFNAELHGGPTITKIFSNVRELFNFHKNLVRQLKLLVESQISTQIFQITSLFTSTVNFSKLYTNYCTNYIENIGILANEKSSNQNFLWFLNDKREACGGRDLSWFLRIPNQRLVHYHYLFKQLLNCSLPSQTLEFTSLTTAVNSILEVILDIERKIDFADNSRAKAVTEVGPHPIQWKCHRDGSWYQIINSNQEVEGWNVVLIGDDINRSKTRLLHTFIEPDKAQSLPLRFRNYVIPIRLDYPFSASSQDVLLRIWDTTGFEEFEKLRILNYPFADVIILTFSISSKEQFQNLIPKWFREIKRYLNRVPMILVGLDAELREKLPAESLVPYSEIQYLANLLSVRYIECSTVTRENLDLVFKESASCFAHLLRYNTFKERDEKGVDDASERVLHSILDTHLDLSMMLVLKNRLPSEIQYCCNLISLDLQWNGFFTLPEELKGLTSLRELNLSHNRLQDVKGIEEMTNLRELNLEANQLNFLPPGLGHCTNLLVLRMADNPLDTLPKDIFPSKCFDENKNANSRNQLFAYLRSIQEGGQAPHHRLKVMFVGDGEVGKTSLLNCFQELQGSQVSRHRKRSNSSVSVLAKRKEGDPPPITDGIEISEVRWTDRDNNEQSDYVWDCWDYAGQDIYYTTHQFFLSAGAVYLVIFNLLNRDFSRIEYWLNSVHTRARGSPIILVGTHLDDPSCTPEYVEDYKNDLKNRYMKRFKNKFGVPSIKCIALISTKLTKKGTPSDEVKALMDRIGTITVKTRLVGKLYPQSWIGLEKHLRSLSAQHDQTPFMTWEKFHNIALNCSISSTDVPEAAAFLHSSGVICHFNDERSGLSDLVILDPQFLTNVMSAVISLRQSFIQQGEILEKNLVFIWRAFDQSLHKKLMSLLEIFEIAFALPPAPEGQKYLIPSLLPENQPSTYSQIWPSLNSEVEYQLGRVYQFKFMPLGFFSRLFVRTLHLPHVRALEYWRNGVIITNDEEKAILRYNPTEYKLTIYVRGNRFVKSRGQLLRLIVENVETVIEGWYETEIEILVPCSHCYEVGSYSPYMFELSECVAQITAGNCFVFCNGIRRIRLDTIAPDITFTDLKKTKLFDFTNDLQIDKVLGQGTFGRVYSAKLKDEWVAVKVLEKTKVDDYEDDPEFKKFNEFQREVWIMSCLKHQNLVHLRGLCLNPLAMIMQLFELGDLYHILYPKDTESESLLLLHNTIRDNMNIRLRIMLDVAKGMRYLHTLSPSIIHRDLRSPNIFLMSLSEQNKPLAKVGDFGLSRLMATTLAGGDFNVNWLAPEVMKEEQYNEKIDVYSFGIIAWELISLTPPFAEFDAKFAGRPRELFKKAVIGGLRPTIPPECPETIAQLINSCWDGNPENRPPFTEIIPKIVAHMLNLGIDVNIDDDDEVTDDHQNLEISEHHSHLSHSRRISMEKAHIVHLDLALEPKHPHSVQCLLLVNNTVWAGCRNGVVRIWDVNTMEFIEDFKASNGSLYTMLIVSSYVWVGADDGSITAFEINPSGSQRKSCKVVKINHSFKKSEPEKKPGIRVLISLREFSDLDPRAKYIRLLSGDTNGNITVWRVSKKSPNKKTEKEKFVSIDSPIDSMIQYNDRIWIGTKNKITVVDVTSKPPKIMASWVAHRGPVNDFACFGHQIWSAGHDGCVCVWDADNFLNYIQDPTPIRKINSHTSRVCAIERIGNYIVSGSFDMSIILYDPKTYEVIEEQIQHKDGVRSLVRVSDTIVWSGSMQRDASICVWVIGNPKVEKINSPGRGY